MLYVVLKMMILFMWMDRLIKCRDIGVINTELILADIEQCEKAIENQRKKTRTNDKGGGI